MNMTPRSHLLTTVFVFVVVLATVLFLVRPAIGKLTQARLALVFAQEQLVRAREVADTYDVLRASIARRAEEARRAEYALPSSKRANDVTALLLGLEAIAEREAGGVFLQHVSLAPLDNEEGGKALVSRRVTIQGLASFDSLMRFLDALKVSLRLLDPISLSFIPETSEDVVPFTLVVDTFVLVQQ